MRSTAFAALAVAMSTIGCGAENPTAKSTGPAPTGAASGTSAETQLVAIRVPNMT